MGLNKVSEAPQGQKDKGIKVSGLGGSEVQPVGLGFLALCIYRLGLMGATQGFGVLGLGRLQLAAVMHGLARSNNDSEALHPAPQPTPRTLAPRPQAPQTPKHTSCIAPRAAVFGKTTKTTVLTPIIAKRDEEE